MDLPENFQKYRIKQCKMSVLLKAICLINAPPQKNYINVSVNCASKLTYYA